MPLGILIGAMITKHIVEATTEGLALLFTFGICGYSIVLCVDDYLRAKARKAKG